MIVLIALSLSHFIFEHLLNPLLCNASKLCCYFNKHVGDNVHIQGCTEVVLQKLQYSVTRIKLSLNLIQY